MKIDRSPVGRLHVISDVAVQDRFTHEQLAEMACAGGADVVQFRDKRLSAEEFLAVARRVREVCARFRVALVVNDRVDVARAIAADGVHLGRGDMSIAEARAALSARSIIGATAGSIEEALLAEREGADYVGFGHVFPTASKTKGSPPVGLGTLAAVCAAVRIPLIAIGGITIANAAEAMRAGAWGLAVIGAVCTTDDPREATARLRAVVYTGKGQ